MSRLQHLAAGVLNRSALAAGSGWEKKNDNSEAHLGVCFSKAWFPPSVHRSTDGQSMALLRAMNAWGVPRKLKSLAKVLSLVMA